LSSQYFLQALEPLLNEIDLVLRRLDPRPGFLLERMYHPKIGVHPYGIKHAVGIAAMLKRHLEHAPSTPLSGLALFRFAAFGSDGKRATHIKLHSGRECVEVSSRTLSHEIGRVSCNEAVLTKLSNQANRW